MLILIPVVAAVTVIGWYYANTSTVPEDVPLRRLAPVRLRADGVRCTSSNTCSTEFVQELKRRIRPRYVQ